ncbi:MAG: iron ABC transporter permease [Caldilineaceae bacterium]|nr:iron ABC transporter permease [Caldilineaceae bacterium]MCB9116966.1 iron ABC transporter permease [Caldilineaceae bacterium]MCB9118412.1 iron ABC transporter permease [Caldilineaceae bacterium]
MTAAVPKQRSLLWRRWQEVRLIGQDPVLAVGLIAVSSFVFLFVALPLIRVIYQGFVDPVTGEFGVEYFTRFVDPYYAPYLWQVIRNTMVMGLGTATGGTILGFIFAYALVRCSFPFGRTVHVATLLPTISPPFAIAIAAILLFGRNGLITRQVLGIRPGPDTNDIYGLDGLIFVQIITFFPVAYLIIRAMLERIDASMEEAALSLRASKFHIFRTITLPLLTPGIAASFLLLFVESLADLGNPLLLGGNASVLSTEIYLAVNGQFDQQKGAALSLILLVPTLTVFLVQRYYISRRSYVAVTGKPTTGRVFVKEPVTRWTFIILTLLTLVVVMMLYFTILWGSFTKLWGVNNELYFGNYVTAFTRGLNAILSTTFLSAVATPVAGVIGVVIAFLVVRRTFAGKQTLDFVSNLGGAVPGTILGIGYIVAFIGAPWFAVLIVYGLLAAYLATRATARGWLAGILLLVGTIAAYYVNWTPLLLGLDETGWRYVLMAGFALLALAGGAFALPGQRRTVALIFGFMALSMFVYNVSPLVTEPMARWGRTLPGVDLPKLVVKASSFITFFTQPTLAIMGYTFLTMAIFAVDRVRGGLRFWIGLAAMALTGSLVFYGNSLALVGTPYIIVAAYAVRSLPASVRAGVASLQQIDPSIEEASNILGGDAQYTFRNVTLPLILPAFFAGLVFAFARHMTSLSAVIFLTTAQWPILTVWILSEVEQGGMSVAAAYSIILIAIVLAAIGLMSLWLKRTYGASQDVDMTVGG